MKNTSKDGLKEEARQLGEIGNAGVAALTRGALLGGFPADAKSDPNRPVETQSMIVNSVDQAPMLSAAGERLAKRTGTFPDWKKTAI